MPPACRQRKLSLAGAAAVGAGTALNAGAGQAGGQAAAGGALDRDVHGEEQRGGAVGAGGGAVLGGGRQGAVVAALRAVLGGGRQGAAVAALNAGGVGVGRLVVGPRYRRLLALGAAALLGSLTRAVSSGVEVLSVVEPVLQAAQRAQRRPQLRAECSLVHLLNTGTHMWAVHVGYTCGLYMWAV